MRYQRQAFISYAHLDNLPLTPDQIGWVSLFHSTLNTLLSQRLGAQCDIWRDDKLRGNDVFSDEIMQQLGDTALFISVLTPRYLKSEWCAREINSFYQQAEASHSLVVGNKSRLIKVLKLPIEDEEVLPDFANQLLGYEFFEFEDDRTPLELDPAYGDKPRQQFLRKINKLAWDISEQLEAIAAEQDSQPASSEDTATAVTAEGERPKVFLAECSRDQREARERIAAELACCGYSVLPQQRLPDDEDEHIAAVQDLLADCILSIHLVGSTPGRVPDGERQQSVVVLQNALAASRSREHGLRRVIWLPAGLASSQESHQAFIHAMQEQAELQQGADLVNGDLETLKSAIHAALRPPEPVPDTGAKGEEPRVHIVCDASDRKSLLPLIKLLRSAGLEVTLPVFTGDAGQIRSANQQLLVDCDAVLLYYGAGDEAWKYHQQNDLRKLQGMPRERTLRASFTCLGQPLSDDKEVMQVMADEDTLDLLDGVDAARLAPLLNALKDTP